MNYIDQINLLNRIRRKDSLRPIEVAMHVILLDACNTDEWENPFSLKNSKIESDLGVTFKTMIAARNRLQQSGLIKFRSKNGSPECIYQILTPNECKEVRTSVKIPKVRDEVTTEVADEVDSEVRDEVNTVYSTGILKQKPKRKVSDDKHPKDQPAEKKEPSVFTRCMEVYCSWFEKEFGAAAKIDGQQGKALKDLIKSSWPQVERKLGAGATEVEIENGIVNSFHVVFTNWSELEVFYQQKTKLSEISSNIQNIIVQIKKKKQQHGEKGGNGQGIGRIGSTAIQNYLNRRHNTNGPEQNTGSQGTETDGANSG